MKLRDANLQVYKKNSFIHCPSFMYLAFIFPECFTITSSEEALCASTISFRKYNEKVVLLVIYLFNYDSPNSPFFMLNMVFDVEYSLCQINWNSSFLAIQRLQGYRSFGSVFWYVIFKENLIVQVVLHCSDIIFYFDICIKFMLSTIIWSIVKTQTSH